MRVVSLSPAIVGKQLGKTIYNNTGKVLLTKGTTLTPSYLDALRRHGYNSVYILNELVPEIEVDDWINEETRQIAVQEVKKLMHKTLQGNARKVDLAAITSIVEQMIAEMDGNSNVIFGLSVLRTVDNYTFVHSTNVAVLSLLLGSTLHYSRDELRTLGIGAILHDLGKIKTPPEILNKPGSLDGGEMSIMQEHARAGFDLLRERLDVSLFSAHIAFQHHERLDGSGYPRGVSGANIHEYGLIGAVADVYDAITSDRVYRPRNEPLKAAEFLVNGKGIHFEPRLVAKLLSKVALYPNGTIVLLKNNCLAVVSGQNPDDIRYPKVALVSGSDRQPVELQFFQTTPADPIQLVLLDFPDGFVNRWKSTTRPANG